MLAKRLQRLAGDDPRTDRGRERLGLKRPERHIFPLLDIPRAPVVQQHKAEDHILRLLLAEHLTHWRRLPDHDAHFELEIEPLAWPKIRQLHRRRFELTARAADLCATNHHGGSATVV